MHFPLLCSFVALCAMRYTQFLLLTSRLQTVRMVAMRNAPDEVNTLIREGSIGNIAGKRKAR